MTNISGNQPVPSSIPPKDSQAQVSQSSSAAGVGEGLQTKETTQPGKSQDIARSINQQDIRQGLLSLNKLPSEANTRIMMEILAHGLPASAEVFDAIEQFGKGKTKGNKLESSVISYSKGLGANTKSVNLISDFLAHNVQMSTVMTQFLARLERFRGSMSNYRNILNPELFTGISSIVGDFLKDMKLLKKKTDKFDLKAILSKEGSLVQDLKYLQEFLKGVQQNLSGKNSLMAEDLKQLLARVVSDSSSLHDVLLTQLVLSKNPQNAQIADNFFHYWLIPNPFVQGARDIEMMVAKDKENLKRINPDQTKIVLKCETSQLGTLTIIIEIDGKQMVQKIYSSKELTRQFVVDYTPDLKKSMADLNYNLTAVKPYKKFNSEYLSHSSFVLSFSSKMYAAAH